MRIYLLGNVYNCIVKYDLIMTEMDILSSEFSALSSMNRYSASQNIHETDLIRILFELNCESRMIPSRSAFETRLNLRSLQVYSSSLECAGKSYESCLYSVNFLFPPVNERMNGI